MVPHEVAHGFSLGSWVLAQHEELVITVFTLNRTLGTNVNVNDGLP